MILSKSAKNYLVKTLFIRLLPKMVLLLKAKDGMTNMIRFVLTKYNLENFLGKIKSLDLSKRWRVNVTEEKAVRSLEQNERLWSLYGSIANYIGEDPSTVHELMGYKFLRYQTEIAGNPVELVKSTTKLSTKEMTEYQENCERWASSLGWSWEL